MARKPRVWIFLASRHVHQMGPDRQGRAGFDFTGMDVVTGFDHAVNIHIAGFPGIDADENAGVPVDFLGGIVECRPIAPMAIDDDQFTDTVGRNAHADIIYQARKGYRC